MYFLNAKPTPNTKDLIKAGIYASINTVGLYVKTGDVSQKLEILDSNPKDSATDISIAATIVVNLNREIDSTTVTNSSFIVTQNGNPINGTITLIGEKIEFHPKEKLLSNLSYSVTLTASIHDKSGTPLQKDYSFTFTTSNEDIISPYVVSVTPAENTTNVSALSTIFLTMSESISPSSVDASSLLVVGEGNAIFGTYIVNGNLIQFTPTSNLTTNAYITVTATENIKDLSGNTLSPRFTYRFQTDNPVGPNIVKTIPKMNYNGASIRRPIEITFDEPIDPTSVTNTSVYILEGNNSVPVTLDTRGNTIYITSASPLLEKTLYSVNLTTAIKDSAGNLMKKNMSYYFRTGIAMQIDSKGNHTCALLPDGTIRCWGLNNKGQLGFEGVITLNDATKSVKLDLGEKAIQIAAGYEYTCALLESGSIKCWGRGTEGQLGYGNYLNIRDANKTLKIQLPERAKSVSTGRDVTCAILESGSFICWGNSDNGLLGWTENGKLPSPVLEPYTQGKVITMPAKVKFLSIGFFQSYLYLENMIGIWFGISDNGLGDRYEKFDPLLSPTDVFLEPAIELSFNSYSANRSEGIYLTANKIGSLGNSNSIVNYDNIINVTAGKEEVCVVLENGKVKCLNDIENYNYDSYNNLKIFDFQKKAIKVKLGEFHYCVILEDESITCWGDNRDGQVGYSDKILVDINEAEFFYLE